MAAGAITTVITLTAQHPNVSGRLIILLAIGAQLLLTGVQRFLR